MQKLSWSVEKITQMAGLRPEDVDDRIIAIAEKCLERNYYLDHAADELVAILRGPRR